MKCENCGAEEDLRPYGRGGAMICFDCGMKDESETSKQFLMQLDAAGDEVIIGLQTGPIPANKARFKQ